MRIMNTKTWLQERADWDWEMGWNKRHIVNFGTRGSRGGSPVYDSMIFEHSGLFHIIITVFSPLLEATRAQELTLCLKNIPIWPSLKWQFALILLWHAWSNMTSVGGDFRVLTCSFLYEFQVPRLCESGFLFWSHWKLYSGQDLGFHLEIHSDHMLGTLLLSALLTQEYSTSMISRPDQAHFTHSAVSNLFK